MDPYQNDQEVAETPDIAESIDKKNDSIYKSILQVEQGENSDDFIVTDNINPKQVLLQRQIEEKMYESFPIKPKTTESIPERITRIRGELDEVEKVLKYSKLQGTILSVDCENANLYQQLKLLEKQYQDLVSTKEYNKLLSSSNKEQAEAIQAAKTLSTQMNNTIAQLKSFVVTAHKPNDPSKTVIELYQSKSTIPTEPNSRLTALESRLKLLEGKVGNWNKQEHPNIAKSMEAIKTKISLVDSQSSEQLISTAKSVMDEINKLNTDEAKTDILQRQLNKINDLYSLTDFAFQYQPNLDNLIQRLYALKNMHETAATIINKAQSLCNEKELIFHTIEDCKLVMQEVTKGLADNMAKLEKNMAFINDKVGQLIPSCK